MCELEISSEKSVLIVSDADGISSNMSNDDSPRSPWDVGLGVGFMSPCSLQR